MLKLSRRAFLYDAGVLSAALALGACSETSPGDATPEVSLMRERQRSSRLASIRATP